MKKNQIRDYDWRCHGHDPETCSACPYVNFDYDGPICFEDECIVDKDEEES